MGAKLSGTVFNRIITTGNDAVELLDTVWDDLRSPVTAINPPGLGSDPTFDTTNIGYSFANGSLNFLFIILQLPHSYKEGTDIVPHIHWMPSTTNTGTVSWRLEYAWVNNLETQPGLTTVDITPTPNGTANKLQLNTFGAISKANAEISSMLTIKLSRLGNTDAFTGNAILKEFDVHFQINTLGSRSEYIK